MSRNDTLMKIYIPGGEIKKIYFHNVVVVPSK